MNDKAPSGRNWLNVKQAAKYAGIGRTTFYDWLREKKVPFPDYPIAYRIRKFDPADIDAWLETVKEEPGTGPVFPRKHK
jgi:excisionase family DNA binding protein